MKTKMLPVRRTKEPYIRTIEAMAKNLQNKTNLYCVIEIKHWGNKDSKLVCQIYISTKNGTFYIYNSWSELQDKYFELMKGE